MKISELLSRSLTAIAGVIGYKSNLSIIPISDLKNVDETWESTGNDPAFLLNGTFFCGWNTITWDFQSEHCIPIKLYWDDGTGFSEDRSQILDFMSAEASQYISTFHIPLGTKKLRIDPGEQECKFKIENLKLKKTNKYYIFIKSIMRILKRHGLDVRTVKKLLKRAFLIYRSQGIKSLIQKVKSVHGAVNSTNSYEVWLSRNAINNTMIGGAKKEIELFKYKPLISVILPVYNVDELWLRKCIDSVINQVYENWELCISDDASTKPHIKKVLNEYKESDNRIKVVFREVNGHISENSNSALGISNGEFIALLDHDDELAAMALYEVVKLLNTYPNVDMIYTDEDKIGLNGERHSPFFKPDWSPDLIMCHMYTCHLGVYRKVLVDQIGGFRKGYEGSQDFDLVLRISELTTQIYHIPKILYHWRAIPESTASGSGAKNYTHYAGIKALEDMLVRRKINGRVVDLEGYHNIYRVNYHLEDEPLVSIIIPTRDMSEVLDKCLNSIVNKTTYKNFEVIIVDNGSREKETFETFTKWERRLKEKLRVITLDIPFNYSRINNIAVEKSKGSLILLLNNDIEVISPNWLYEMVCYSLRDNTGAVGAKLFYPDYTVQHSGVIMGLGGVAGHAFRTCNESDPGYFGMLLTNRNCSVVTAACLMVKRELFNEVGGLEEELSVAFNDVDFCLKLIDRGYYNVCLNSVSLFHHESKTRGTEDTPEKKERFSKEINYMLNKWPQFINEDPFYNRNLSLESDKSYSIKS